MGGWQELLTEVDRVRDHTDEEVLAGLDEDLRRRIDGYRQADEHVIATRLEELDREWDIERVLIVNASTLVTAGALIGLFRRRALAIPLVVGGFLLQHGLQGWCPPLALFRRLGVRTRREIDLERYALRALRGDLARVADAPSEDLLDLVAQR